MKTGLRINNRRKPGNWIPVSIGAGGLAMISFAAFGLAAECCSTCEASASHSVNTMVANTTSVANTGSDTGCDPCNMCAACAENERETTVDSVESENNDEKDWLAKLAPWITPIGGLMFVSAHLLNRRYGSISGCC